MYQKEMDRLKDLQHYLGDGRGWSRGELGLLPGDDEAALLTAEVGGRDIGSGDLSTSKL